MYSTKRTNKYLVDGNAFNCIGDPYRTQLTNPFRQGKPGEKLKRFESHMFPKNEENGNFTKLTYVSAEYAEGNLEIRERTDSEARTLINVTSLPTITARSNIGR